MFKSALIKLTFWYTLIAMILSLLFSIVLYHFATVQLRVGLNHQYSLIEPSGSETNLTEQEFSDRASDLYIELIYFNFVVLVFATTGSYFLARRTLKPIKAAHEAQVRFSGLASHELRTPLAAIRADTESVLMLKRADAGLLKQTLKSNLEDIKRIEDLANHLLEITRSRSISKLSKQRSEIGPIIESAIVEMKNLYKNKPEINYNGISASSEISSADIKQVILPLIDNAIKHGQKNQPITIETKRERKYFVISVKNKGSIPQTDLDHVFEPFYRSSLARTNNSEGYGLGLALAKEIIEANGGRMTAYSDDNEVIMQIYLPKAK